MRWERCHAIRWGHTTCSYCSAVLDICYFDVGGVYIGQKVDMATEKRNRRLPVQATPPCTLTFLSSPVTGHLHLHADNHVPPVPPPLVLMTCNEFVAPFSISTNSSVQHRQTLLARRGGARGNLQHPHTQTHDQNSCVLHLISSVSSHVLR